MKFSFVSIFPNLIKPYFSDSILARALVNELILLDFIDPRDFSKERHKKVDEYMIGGGAGLLMTCEPFDEALKFIQAKEPNTHFVFLSPVGKKFSQNDAKRLAKKEHICLVCGRYEGVDERILELWADEVFSIGDFVLTGGELGALCIADAVARNVKGVLGNEQSLAEESFEGDLLEAPSFAKPIFFQKIGVVSDFLKGNHANIRTLKKTMALCKTRFFRPDLYKKFKPQNKEKL